MLTTHRVLVVDDHPVFRRGMRVLLQGEAWVEHVTEAATVRDAVREAVVGRVTAAVMDLSLPDGDGIEATERVLIARPGTAILVVTMTRDEHLVTRALAAGARGYALKDADPEVLLDALKTVAHGGVALGPGVGVGAFRGPVTPVPEPLTRLTERERELLAHLAGGAGNAHIARALGLSEKTVRNQLSIVFTKLAVRDRVGAALLARELGLTVPGRAAIAREMGTRDP